MAEENKKVEEPKVEETKNENKDKDKVTKVDMSSKKTEKTITKVDLSKPPVQQSEEVEKQPAKEEEVVVVNPEPQEEPKEDTPVLQEVTNEPKKVEAPSVKQVPSDISSNLPENIQKVVQFMEETGGDLNDYVNLNRDISKLDDSDVLDEYYRTTKSHLTPEERNFLLEEKFGFDNEIDDAKEIKRKKIALKEQVAEARAHLDRQKSKYYEEIKAGSKLTQEQKEAIDFYNRYSVESAEQERITEESVKDFQQKTKNVFNDDFKGFDYQVGDKKFRFNVKDIDSVRETQSDISNFVNKFIDKKTNTIGDATGYHKSLYTAMNADAIARHFYEQGKADAIQSTIAKDKNINMDPRKTHGEVSAGGIKVRALGDSSKDFKFKIRKTN